MSVRSTVDITKATVVTQCGVGLSENSKTLDTGAHHNVKSSCWGLTKKKREAKYEAGFLPYPCNGSSSVDAHLDLKASGRIMGNLANTAYPFDL